MEKVDNDLDQTMHLWKEGRYDDLLKIYGRLYQYAPNHTRLRELITKLNDTLANHQKNERQAVAQKMLADATTHIHQKHFGDAIQACN